MSVRTKTYIVPQGGTYFTDPELANVTVFCVTRSGMTHYEVDELPENLEFFYERGPGRIWFNPLNPFNGPVYPERPAINALEKISVKFRI